MRKIFIITVIVVIFMFAAPAVAQEEENTEDIEDKALEWIRAITADYAALGTATMLAVQIFKVIGSYLKLPDGYSGYILIVVGVIVTGFAFGAKILDRQAELDSWAGIAEQAGNTVINILVALGIYKVTDWLELIKGIALPTWKKQ
jgi:hypothetical protein